MSTLKCVLGHPTLRLIAAALPLLGAHNASAYPNQSLIAIEKIGLSKGTFSLVLVVALVVAVTSSVLFGILGNQYRRGRPIALITGRSADTARSSGMPRMKTPLAATPVFFSKNAKSDLGSEAGTMIGA